MRTQALDIAALRALATMLHVELVVIDADTTTNGFADHLRWNQAYYRLAAGLPGGR